MAIESVCGKLQSGQDQSCLPIKRRYYQQAVVINKSDIEASSVEFFFTDFESPSPVCNYGVSFSLKDGATGYRFIGVGAGSAYFGSFDKTRSDYGIPQYAHNANLLIVGADVDAKCILSSLDKGSYVVAYQFADGTVEIWGFENGLTTGDYTYDVQGGAGGSAIILSSLENAPENYLPLVYISQTPGSEGADFDAAFANTGS